MGELSIGAASYRKLSLTPYHVMHRTLSQKITDSYLEIVVGLSNGVTADLFIPLGAHHIRVEITAKQ